MNLKEFLNEHKKITVAIAIAVFYFASCTGSFLFGRYRRLASLPENGVADRLEQQQQRINELESELSKRIGEVEYLEQQLGSINSGIDGCLRITGQLRQTVDDTAITSGNINILVKELRNRVVVYERTIEELNNKMQSIKDGSNKQ